MTLYNNLGGEQGIGQIVDDFYKLIMADNTLNHFFAHTDMQKQRRLQISFFSKIFEGQTNTQVARWRKHTRV